MVIYFFEYCVQILKATGMPKKDSDAVMGMIMDVSGARDTIDDALGMLNDLNFFGMEGEIMGATEKLSTVYDQLEKSMKPKQTKDLDKRGFTFMDMTQINKIYRDPGELNNTIFLFNYSSVIFFTV